MKIKIVQYVGGWFANDIYRIPSGFIDASSANSTSARFYSPNFQNAYYKITGVGLTYEGNKLVGGTVNSIAAYAMIDGKYELAMTIRPAGGGDLNLSVADWKDGIVSNQGIPLTWESSDYDATRVTRYAFDSFNYDGVGAIFAGTAGVDVFQGTDRYDLTLGRGGDDRLYGGNGDDIFIGSGGKDRLYGEDGNDILYGGTGDDTLSGGSGRDTANFAQGLAPEDPSNNAATVDLATGLATLSYGDTDTLISIENVAGSNVDDRIFGSGQGNYLFGSQGDDKIDGRDGNDYVGGGQGVNTLTGGAGLDSFVFINAPAVDKITDFSHADDTLVFDVYSHGLTNKIVADNLLIRSDTGHSAKDAEDRFIYNTQTGKLYYDWDGTGTEAAAQHIATLLGSPDDIDLSDFRLTYTIKYTFDLYV